MTMNKSFKKDRMAKSIFADNFKFVSLSRRNRFTKSIKLQRSYQHNYSSIETTFIVVIIIFLFLPSSINAQNVVDYVNPLIGTSARGNTIPAVCVPFAMTQWTPQTRSTEQKCQAPYYFKDKYFSGFRGTHWLSGSCTQDYGSVTIMPVSGHLKTITTDFQCEFAHSQEIASPYFYSIKLSRYNILAEITATARCSIMKFTCNKNDSLYLLVNPNSDKNKAYIKIDRQHHEIVGYNPVYRIYQGWGHRAGFNGYFVIQFSSSLSNTGTFADSTIFTIDSLRNRKNEGAYAGFKMRKDNPILVKVGTSFSSIEEAKKNLATEIPDWDFETVKNKTKAIWKKNLEKIQVSGGIEKNKKIFYTALYHTMQQPRLFNDVDGTYPKFSQQYNLAKIRKGNYYDDFSMWDIYRAEIPLYEIIEPSLVNDWVNSVILKGQEGGWLPIFPCWNNYTSEMIGDHSIIFIASAFLKGINGYDIKDAYRLMRQNAFDTPSEKDYINGKGRRALLSYIQSGYVPMDDRVIGAFHKDEQVSRTLEYAYDDYSLAQVAKVLEKYKDYKILIQRSINYKNVFDTALGLMNGKYISGRWYSPFSPDKRTSFVTESTPRLYTFYVPHDIPGLAKLMGGRDRLELSLDSLFLHGNYKYGNEPSQQVPFLYNYTSHPWKSQLLVRKILNDKFSDGPNGLSGNDDAGEISACYLLSSMGFYPVNPVSNEYLITSPLFDKIDIKINEKNSFRIITHRQSSKSIYIYQTKWKGMPYTKNYITYQLMMKGGTFEIFLGDNPSRWGSKTINQPRGLSLN